MKAAVEQKASTEESLKTTRTDLIAEETTVHKDQEHLSHAQDKLARTLRDRELASAQKDTLVTALAVATDRAQKAADRLARSKQAVEDVEAKLDGDADLSKGAVAALEEATENATETRSALEDATNSRRVRVPLKSAARDSVSCFHRWRKTRCHQVTTRKQQQGSH